MQLARTTREINVAALVCAGLALALYSLTLAPTFGWGDSADLALRMVYEGDQTFIYSSRHYTFYRWVAGLFQYLPFGDTGTRANFASAVFGAATVGLVAWISGYVARHRYAAYAAGISLAVSHTFWLMSTLAEVYTFNAMLIFACYACMVVWWRTHKFAALAGAALFAGMTLTHHATGLLLTATIAPLVLARIHQLSIGHIAALFVLFIMASLPYWQPVIMLLQAGHPVLKALRLDEPNNPFFAVEPLRELIKFIAYAGYNFFGLAGLLALWGLITAWKKCLWELLPPVLWFLLLVYGGVMSSIPDKFNIYVLVYPVLAIMVGMGAARLEQGWVGTAKPVMALLLALAVVPPLGYLAAIKITRALHIDLVGARTVPYRDNAWYFMWPAKNGDVGPRRYAEEALQAVRPNSVLIADYSLWRPLYFLQAVEGMRPDVTLQWAERIPVTDTIKKLPCSQDVYLATDTPAAYYQLDELRKYYALKQNGVVFKVMRNCR